MSNLRNLNQANPWTDLLGQLNHLPNTHPLFAAFNPEARDRGAPPSYSGPEQPNRENNNNTPPSSDEDPPMAAPPEDGPTRYGHPHRQGRHHHHQPGMMGGGAHQGRGRHCGGGGYGGPWGGAARGPWGGRHRGMGMGGGGFDMSRLADFIGQFVPELGAEMKNQSARGAGVGGEGGSTGGKDFAPEADIFDTEEGYVVHVSLPGAKKEDVGVNWDADKSELNVAGVIYRPGDEEFLKTLALDERRVGVFERGIKLGTKERPANVDTEGIEAKMEDGVLVVRIPKLERGFVDVKKVDIN